MSVNSGHASEKSHLIIDTDRTQDIEWGQRQSNVHHICLVFFLGTFFLLVMGGLVHILQSRPLVHTLDSQDDRHPSEVVNFLNQASIESKIQPGCEVTVMLMRHCEKSGPSHRAHDGSEHCSYIGFERASFLPTLFGSRWPVPSRLFAYTTKRHSFLNFRELETLQPLADKMDMVVEIADQESLPETVLSLVASGDSCGRFMVVCWKHDLMPSLATSLGCGSSQGCPATYSDDEFDQVWQLKYVYRTPEPEVMGGMEHKTRFPRHLKEKKGWYVYGHVSYQRFDPLEFSNSVGDYPLSKGNPTGGYWWNNADL